MTDDHTKHPRFPEFVAVMAELGWQRETDSGAAKAVGVPVFMNEHTGRFAADGSKTIRGFWRIFARGMECAATNNRG